MNYETAPQGDLLEPWRTVPALADALNSGADRPSFTVPSLRNLLAQRERNGLAPFTRKLGRKLLVSETGFNWWLTHQPVQGELDLRGGA